MQLPTTRLKRAIVVSYPVGHAGAAVGWGVVAEPLWVVAHSVFALFGVAVASRWW